jgi:hypothetical protein
MKRLNGKPKAYRYVLRQSRKAHSANSSYNPTDFRGLAKSI